MDCIVVTDCGGTKCAWCATTADGSHHTIQTAGFNCAVSTPEQIRESVGEACASLTAAGLHPREIHFYGAGCIDQKAKDMETTLSCIFPDAKAEAQSDLMGAARALFGHNPGIACILGTGSNAALYDGEKFVARIPTLGWALGDEGSGAYLGRLLIVSILRGTLPQEVTEKFQQRYHLTEAEAIEAVYRKPGANAWLASFAPFLAENISRPEVEALVTKAFLAFREASVDRYLHMAEEIFGTAALPQIEIAAVGSVAHYFSSVLSRVMAPTKLRTLREPLMALARFHTFGNMAGML